MNIIAYLFLMFIGGALWFYSGVGVTKKYFWIGLVVLAILWWGLWGQVAIYDGWWIYSSSSLSLGHIGTIPVADGLYFFAGLGWYLYLCRKLRIL
jgi:hypothetical protein